LLFVRTSGVRAILATRTAEHRWGTATRRPQRTRPSRRRESPSSPLPGLQPKQSRRQPEPASPQPPERRPRPPRGHPGPAQPSLPPPSPPLPRPQCRRTQPGAPTLAFPQMRDDPDHRGQERSRGRPGDRPLRDRPGVRRPHGPHCAGHETPAKAPQPAPRPRLHELPSGRSKRRPPRGPPLTLGTRLSGSSPGLLPPRGPASSR